MSGDWSSCRRAGVCVLLSVLTALVVTLTSACLPLAPRSTPAPFPTPLPLSTPDLGSILSRADPLCEGAFSAEAGDGMPVPPLLVVSKAAGEESGWHLDRSLVPHQAESVAEIKTLVCVRHAYVVIGRYTDGRSAVRIDWHVRLVNLPDGTVVGKHTLKGPDPPGMMTKGSSKDAVFGSPPEIQFVEWIISNLASDTILYGGFGLTGIAFSPDGGTLAIQPRHTELTIWNAASGQQERSIDTFTEDDNVNAPREIAFTPDWSTLIVGFRDWIRVWDLETGSRTQDFITGHGVLTYLALSADGRTLASVGHDDKVRIWDAEGWQEVRTLQGPTDDVATLVFSPDGQTLALGSTDGTVRLWFPTKGWRGRTLEGHRDKVSAVAFSPDGQVLASGEGEGTVRLWYAEKRWRGYTLEAHSGRVRDLAFSPDGTMVASGSEDASVKLWDAKTRAHMYTLIGHSGRVVCVAFSPDGHVLASGGQDAMVRLWDPATGRELAVLSGHAEEVQFLAFSPDGQTLASGSSDDTVRLWNVAEVAGSAK